MISLMIHFLVEEKRMNTAKSNTVKIFSLDLPKENVPSSFNGAVGEFSLNAKVDKSEVKANEPISLKLELSGTGNLPLVKIPEVNLPTGFEKYEPKVSDQLSRSSKVGGKKIIEYLLVPRLPGKSTIPPIEFSFFNPTSKSYVTLTTSSFSINVLKGEGSADVAYVHKEGIKVLGDDIRFVKTILGSIENRGELLLFTSGFWAAVVFPLFALVGLVVWKRRSDKLSGNLQLLRYQRAEKMAKSRLKTAKSFMSENKQIEFYDEISKALFGYLEDKLQIPKAELTLEAVVQKLQQASLKQEILDKLKNCVEKCEMIRFAPKEDGVGAMNQIYNDSANVIIEIEKTLSNK